MPTVFYAWQSDRDAAICRKLIRAAAKHALTKLKAEPDIFNAPSFVLDQDRQGVPGHPHIASVIRRKIKACDVFLADLTHVASYTAAGKAGKSRRKKTPNPNVLIELGIAIRAKGFGRLILVMNDHFGSTDDLPFDVKSHSFPITYTLADANDEKQVKAVQDKLAERIATALKPMLAEIAAAATATATASGRERADADGKGFYHTFTQGNFYGMHPKDIPFIVAGSGEQSILNPRSAYVLLSIFPLKPLKQSLDMRKIEPTRPDEFRPMGEGSVTFDGFGQTNIAYVGPGIVGNEPLSVVELSDEGIIHAAWKMVVHTARADKKDVINFAHVERTLLKQLAVYVKLLRVFGVHGPLEVRVLLHNVADAYLSPSEPLYWDHRRFRPLVDGTQIALPVTLDGKIDESDVYEVAGALRPSLTVIWRDAGYLGDPCFDQSDKFIAEGPQA